MRRGPAVTPEERGERMGRIPILAAGLHTVGIGVELAIRCAACVAVEALEVDLVARTVEVAEVLANGSAVQVDAAVVGALADQIVAAVDHRVVVGATLVAEEPVAMEFLAEPVAAAVVVDASPMVVAVVVARPVVAVAGSVVAER